MVPCIRVEIIIRVVSEQKQGKQFNICLLVKHQVQIQFLLKSLKLVDYQWQKKMTELFQCMWRKEAFPQYFKDASIIHLYKRKGNPQVCDNHRGISLLSIAGKILTNLLNCPNAHLDQAGLIPESQCGFKNDRGTIDIIFTDRQLQEKCQEQNVDLYMTFVYLTKAFDTVSCDGLWKIMAKFGCPPRFIGTVDRMSKACDSFQLTISTKKTEIVHQPAPGKPYSEPIITVNGQKLQVVDKFTYL